MNNISNSYFHSFLAHFEASLLGSIWGPILRARIVIGAIVGARGAPECLKAGGSCERLFQGASEMRVGGGEGP